MKIHQLTNEEIFKSDPVKEKIVRDFIEFTKNRLKIKQPFTLEFSYDTEDARRHHHTGYYDFKKNKLWVYAGHRNLVDILRTLCHELVHVKQDELNQLHHHDAAGSPHEQVADEIAGYLIKIYVKKHHNIID